MNVSWQAAVFFLILVIVVAFVVWIHGRVLNKAGFSRWWVLLVLVPIVNLAAIWVFAFVDWPRLETDIET